MDWTLPDAREYSSHPGRPAHRICTFILNFGNVVWSRLQELGLRGDSWRLGVGRQVARGQGVGLGDLVGGMCTRVHMA